MTQEAQLSIPNKTKEDTMRIQQSKAGDQWFIMCESQKGTETICAVWYSKDRAVKEMAIKSSAIRTKKQVV